MTLRSVAEHMMADQDFRELMRKRRPKSDRVPTPQPVVDPLPSGEDVTVVQLRGPDRTHQCWECLRLYKAGESVEAIATKLSITADTARSWILQAMQAGARR